MNRGVITTKATKAAALVDFWDYDKLRNGPNSLADLKKKISLFFYQAKNLLKHTGSSLQNCRNKYFTILPSIIKTHFNYSECFLQIWRNKDFLVILPSKKKLLKYTESSLKNWKKCAKDQLDQPTWISWVFWAESKPIMLMNRGWF